MRTRLLASTAAASTAAWPFSSLLRMFGKADIIRMDLSGGSYSWKFVAVDGTANGADMDSGSEACH